MPAPSRSVRLLGRTCQADAVVIAAGVWSRQVSAWLGVRIEVAAGTMEFDRAPDRFRQGRVEALVAAARPYLPGADRDRREQEWMDGAPPVTPEGLPLIGPLPGRPRVLLATGHNMLGLMPAPATGRLMAGLLPGNADPGPAARFTPGRSVRCRD
ncbi:glycine/D-amino acid oxidase-like deaminating enzyme [Streptomyces sp. V4I8]|uniref:NAD(P)/FAD-dependent oxidoreductase n=1 Tax=Streptomyces sp. V4I8 TaxID=3156469 RepID=UPI003512535F